MDCNSSQIVFLLKVIWSSRISLQNSLTVFLFFLFAFIAGALFGVALLPFGWCNWTPKNKAGGSEDFDGGGGGGIVLTGIGGGINPGIGGGSSPFKGGGGGGPKDVVRILKGSASSHDCMSVKSKSEICNGRSNVFSKLSQWSSFSDFFRSTFPVVVEALSKFLRSWRDLDFMSSSLALETMPLKSPKRIALSSVGEVTNVLDMWLACRSIIRY